MKPQLCRSNVQHAFRLAHLALLTICAFVAFAALSAVAGETSSKGEKFLWTYDHGDSLEPATPGSRPTGLVFDYAGRRDGLVILLK